MTSSQLIFISGSSDGLGLLAAQKLIALGHRVHLHAKNESRKKDLEQRVSGYQFIHVADFTVVEALEQLAVALNEIGRFDTIVHNAGIYNASAETLFRVNVLAPYLLSTLVLPPQQHIYVSSDMHLNGAPKLEALEQRKFTIDYADSKLLLMLLMKGFVRQWPSVRVHALHPGWVPTKMGGANAPDDLEKGYETQVWLATTADALALSTGHYFFHQRLHAYHPLADDRQLQARLLAICDSYRPTSRPL